MEGTVGIALQSRATYQEGRYCIHFDKNFVFAIFKGTVVPAGAIRERTADSPVCGGTAPFIGTYAWRIRHAPRIYEVIS